jgi:hypothetical protein
MGLYQNSNDDLSALISSQLGQTVTSSQYSVLGIRATTSADEPASNGANTKVAITCKGKPPSSLTVWI